MNITLKNAAAAEKMRGAGRIVADTLRLLGQSVRPGMKTAELNEMADKYIRSRGAVPTFLNYNGFPKSICVSVNSQVVHGIPGHLTLREGDIVSCDVGAILNGYHGDAARTFKVGQVSPACEKLMQVTRECFFKALAFCKQGYRVSDISRAVQTHAEAHGYGVVRELVGHGLGTALHEDPEVPNYVSKRGGDPRLVPGMTLAIEPMINMGTAAVWTQSDGWTVVTRDGKPSAHYENSILITEGEPEILTLLEGELPF